MSSDGRPQGRSPNHGGSRSGSQYALCALGVALIALGIVMIVWTVIPMDAEGPKTSNVTANDDDSTSPTQSPGPNQDVSAKDKMKASSSVAYVLVGAGAAMLLLSICLGVRNKRRENQRARDAVVVGTPYVDRVAGEPAEAAQPVPTYDVPSYEDAVGSGQYPIRQSNLRNSTSQLPSYEDLISAVEAEGEGPISKPAGEAPNTTTTPAASDPAAANPPSRRSSSRASKILRPLRVRRIKSEKLHLKDFRLNIRSPSQARVTIEPITPPPQYDDKMPEL
ncbi:transmembrane protein 51b [Osmerus eperlanus]|uniref:transmembrane protein 51b n=1 Tax=Osmerus eperlanus TaxID=29151 RepID=UPI002E140EB3